VPGSRVNAAKMSRGQAHHGMTDKTTPLYVVCSPCRRVGKTLLSRLLTEFYVVNDRPVAAFDLADEGPQLADYLPNITTVVDIADTRGQMAFFDQLIAHFVGPRIVDLSHRAFAKFFTVVQEIRFFEEARHRSIEPLVLYIIDPDPKSAKAYAMLRHQLSQASLLPVRNRIKIAALSGDARPKANVNPTSLDIPLLGLPLRTLVDQPSFSFSSLRRASPPDLPASLESELSPWVEYVFFQFRVLEHRLGCA
jgi:hypothetical protein